MGPPQRDVQRVRPGTTSCPRNDSVSEDSTFYFSALLGGVDYFHIPLLFQFPILASAFQFLFPLSTLKKSHSLLMLQQITTVVQRLISLPGETLQKQVVDVGLRRRQSVARAGT